MAANVGLSTPRGSGTSGYVQRNYANLKPRDTTSPYPNKELLKHRQRQPDASILEHERKRRIEAQVFEERVKLEDDEVPEEEIEERTEELRKKLLRELEDESNSDRRGGKAGRSGKGLKPHQVHELAEAKIEESERLRKALGISKDYEEGSHWRKQEERLKGGLKEDNAPEERDEQRR